MPGRSGPIPKGDAGVSLSRLTYKCVVENCDYSMRSDRFKAHFEKCSDFTVLDQAKKMSNALHGEDHIKKLVINTLKVYPLLLNQCFKLIHLVDQQLNNYLRIFQIKWSNLI